MTDQKGPSARPLSPRLRADNRPAIPLNHLQIEAREQLIAKLANGTYRLVDVDCPLCGSTRKKLLSEKDSTGVPVETSLCLACGIVYASRRLDSASLNAFYENENLKLDRGVEFAAEILFQSEHTQGSHIAEVLGARGFLEKLRDSLIIEIGCGPGGILAHFRKLGFDVVGFDIDPSVVAYGRSQGLELHHGDTDMARSVLQSKGKRVGLLIYSQALEHMADPPLELEKAKQLIDGETLIFIGVPGLRNLGPHYGYDFLNYLQPGHLIHFEQLTLSRLLNSQGFEEVFADEKIDSIFRLAASTSPERASASNPAPAILAFLTEAEQKWSRKAAWKRIRSGVGKTLRPLARFLGRNRAA